MRAHIVLAHPEPQSFNAHLAHQARAADERPVVPFNPMSDWGPDGRIRPEAPVYSPYVRHKRDLDLG